MQLMDVVPGEQPSEFAGRLGVQVLFGRDEHETTAWPQLAQRPLKEQLIEVETPRGGFKQASVELPLLDAEARDRNVRRVADDVVVEFQPGGSEVVLLPDLDLRNLREAASGMHRVYGVGFDAHNSRDYLPVVPAPPQNPGDEFAPSASWVEHRARRRRLPPGKQLLHHQVHDRFRSGNKAFHRELTLRGLSWTNKHRNLIPLHSRRQAMAIRGNAHPSHAPTGRNVCR